jgi:5-methylcytosine-specific restriction endonuclease McrA
MALAARSALPSTTTDLDRLGDELAALAAHLDAATARFLALLREFDTRGGWADGFRSCAEWLGWRVGLAPGAAREHVRVARALGELPRLAEALARGEVSYSKVRALTRVATPETEARLLAVAQAGTAAHVERIVRGWRRVDAQGEVPDAAARHERRWLQVYPDEDGMMVVRGRLTPEAGAVLVRALEAARQALNQQRRANAAAEPEVEPPTYGQQQADALALVAETALAQGLDPAPGQERYQVVVHVDAAVLADPERPGQAALEDGVSVPAETSRRLACDATRVVMRHAADGSVLDVGRRTRAIPPALRRALQARDRGCRFPGCGVRHAQGHHLQHWANGGPTRLDNLALLCRRHHRAVHEEGYRVVRLANGALRFHTQAGRPLPEAPAPPAVPANPAAALLAAHRAQGLAIDAWTACPDWHGERLDLGWALDVLHPAANPGAYSCRNKTRARGQGGGGGR